MVQINLLGVERLYSSSPGSLAEGFIGVDNSGDTQILDVIWCYGLIDGEDFNVYGFIIDDAISFPGQSSYAYETGSFATPNAPGTWDLMGILADDIYFDDPTIHINGTQAIGTAQGGWTISGAAGDLNVTSVSVGSG